MRPGLFRLVSFLTILAIVFIWFFWVVLVEFGGRYR